MRRRAYLPRVTFSSLGAGTGRIARSRSLKPNTPETSNSLTGNLSQEFETHSDLGTYRSPCQAIGKSGVRHNFTFGFGEIPALNVVGDFVEDIAPVDETKVLSLFIKVYDVGAKHALLCVIPSLTAEAKKLSGLYKITTAEAADRTRLAAVATETLNRLSKNV